MDNGELRLLRRRITEAEKRIYHLGGEYVDI